MNLPADGGRALRVGTFVKTPSPHVIELLGFAGLDFAIVDAEHGPFDRATVDIMMLASRAAGLPLMVRLPDDRPSTILWALDLGSSGIIVPHVDDAGQARAIVRAAKYLTGERGFSNGPRAAGYGTRQTSTIIADGNAVEIICQIESVTAVQAVDDIAAVPGVDGLMIGRADLALSFGTTDMAADVVTEAAERSLRAARNAGKWAVIVATDAGGAAPFVSLGANMVVVGSDQQLLRIAASNMAQSTRTEGLTASAPSGDRQ